MTTRTLLTASASLRRTTHARLAAFGLLRALPLGGRPLALLLSVSAHVALALAFARAAPRATSLATQSGDVLVEIAALDLAVADPPAPIMHSQRAILAPHHSHPYPVAPGHDLTPHDPALRHDEPARSADDAGPVTPEALGDAPSPITPRFVMTMGSRARIPDAGAAIDGRAGTTSFGVADKPVPEAAVDTAATLLSGCARYTRQAEAAGVEATVPLEIVVDRTGAVIDARVLAHVGYGLDEAALQGIRAYRFSPARRAGKTLAVRMRWMMRFQLR